MNQRGQTSGVIGGIIAGMGALIITVIVILTILNTMDDSNLLRETAATVTVTDTSAWINTTAYTLTDYSATGINSIRRSFAISSIKNYTNGITIAAGNYTFTAATASLINASATTWPKVNITYTYTDYTDYEAAQYNINTNFTGGIDNVSKKIPTILLLAAIVLLLGVLTFLVMQARQTGYLTQGQGSI